MLLKIIVLHQTAGWLVVLYIFYFNIWVVILPTDELVFFRGLGLPPVIKLRGAVNLAN